MPRINTGNESRCLTRLQFFRSGESKRSSAFLAVLHPLDMETKTIRTQNSTCFFQSPISPNHFRALGKNGKSNGFPMVLPLASFSATLRTPPFGDAKCTCSSKSGKKGLQPKFPKCEMPAGRHIIMILGPRLVGPVPAQDINQPANVFLLLSY